MNYNFKSNEFEGPLDLLLHLIKKENIDIFDISIKKITKQYMDYINQMKTMNLDISSEYLVMAAELIELKSKLLLPNKTEEIEEEIEEEKNDLINKLIEYEKYKNMTNTFKELESIRKEIYTRESNELLQYTNNSNINYDIDLNDLVKAFQKFLQNRELSKPLNTRITKKEYSVNIRCNEIRNKLKNRKHVKFEDNILSVKIPLNTFN